MYIVRNTYNALINVITEVNSGRSNLTKIRRQQIQREETGAVTSSDPMFLPHTARGRGNKKLIIQ